MAQKYNHKEIEEVWQKKWFDSNLYAAEDFSKKPKKYILVEFPYPSGSKLHMGHVMRYTIPEIYSRKLRMSGYNVMFPMGWDAFGLPAENYAVKTGVHPSETTQKAIETFRNLFQQMGYAIDWKRETNSTDPGYYKWTQWIFLKFWEQGLAELKEEPVWWSESLKTILANEEVIKDENGILVAERDGKSTVEKRLLKQWVLKIPEYADKLIQGLSEVDFPESIRSAQINWIGRSDGAEIIWDVLDKDGNKKDWQINTFTTRFDTIPGPTFIVVAPEFTRVQDLITAENIAINDAYIKKTKAKSELERLSSKEKTGAFTGSYAINPYNGDVVPVYIADYVLANYGTGAVMGMPGHDQRDFEFAAKYGLPVKYTLKPKDGEVHEGKAYEGEGYEINSGEFDGLWYSDAKAKILEKLLAEGKAIKKVNYKLRDWLFSRQRYWGEPIPLVHKQDGTVEAIANTNNPEEVKANLPLILPQVPDYTPSSDATSPLAKNLNWVNTTTKDGSPAMRETNTMPNWAGSCWYYLRYIDPHNDTEFADMEKMKYWLPVDQYFGGSEHTTLHLLYSRFWHKFLFDQKLVPTAEPYQWRMNGGVLLGPDGEKMSKSRGNVINPGDDIDLYGVDALRTYVCFMGPYDGTIIWSVGGLKACRNMIDDIVDLQSKVAQNVTSDAKFVSSYNRMIKRVTDMVDNLKMNTAISEFMIFVNAAKKQNQIDLDLWKGFLKAYAPFGPFITEELWQKTNKFPEWTNENSIHVQSWPEYDKNLIQQEAIIVGVQVNGKLRSEVEVSLLDSEEVIKDRVLNLPDVKKWMEGHTAKKFIYVPGKIVNLVF